MKYLIILLIFSSCASSQLETKNDLYFRIKNYCAMRAYDKLKTNTYISTYTQCMSDFLYFEKLND